MSVTASPDQCWVFVCLDAHQNKWFTHLPVCYVFNGKSPVTHVSLNGTPRSLTTVTDHGHWPRSLTIVTHVHCTSYMYKSISLAPAYFIHSQFAVQHVTRPLSTINHFTIGNSNYPRYPQLPNKKLTGWIASVIQCNKDCNRENIWRKVNGVTGDRCVWGPFFMGVHNMTPVSCRKWIPWKIGHAGPYPL